MLVCRINTDKYNKNLSEDFKLYLNDILTSDFGGPNVGEIGKFYLQQGLSNIVTVNETINDAPLETIIAKLYNNIDIVETIDSNGKIYYKVGWFDTELSNFATILEYGSQIDTNYIQAKSVITKILLSQERGSFADICTQQIENNLIKILDKLEVK